MFDFALCVQIVIVLIASAGIVVNSLVLRALLDIKLGSRLSTLLLRSQCVADLYTCAIIFVYKVTPVDVMTGVVWLDKFLCHIWSYDNMIWIGLMASVHNLVCISFDRYMAVMHPVVYKAKQRLLIAATFTYLFSMASFLAGPNPFLRRYDAGRCLRALATDDAWLDVFFTVQGYFWMLLAYLLPAVFLMTTHLVAVVRINRQQLQGASGSNSRRRLKRLVVTTFVMAGSLLVLHLFEAVTYVGSHVGLINYAVGTPRQQAGVALLAMSCLVNPVVMVVLTDSVKCRLVRLLRLNVCCPTYWAELLKADVSSTDPTST